MQFHTCKVELGNVILYPVNIFEYVYTRLELT